MPEQAVPNDLLTASTKKRPMISDSFMKWVIFMNAVGSGLAIGGISVAVAYHSLLHVGPAPSPFSRLVIFGLLAVIAAGVNWHNLRYVPTPKELPIVGRIP